MQVTVCESEVPLCRTQVPVPAPVLVLSSGSHVSVNRILRRAPLTRSFSKHLWRSYYHAGDLGYICEQTRQTWIIYSRRVCQWLLLCDRLPPNLSGIF